ncbi:hypothetical protein [Saccharospirillum alexandrii]|uniref:hypothetical protein n=1 Tax=Saccharospirillum alexandrii TaxID=2448477 RepID=UPI003734EB05
MEHRVVIFGRGSIGMRHLNVFSDLLPQGSVLSLPAGLRQQESVESLVQRAVAHQPTIAIIAVPAPFHIPFMAALTGNVSRMLIEKPLCTDRQSLEHFQQRMDTTDVWVGYNLHYRDEFQFLAEAINGLGPLRWAEFRCGQSLDQWRPGRDLTQTVSLKPEWGGGVLWELSHDLEMAQSLLGPLTLDRIHRQRGRFSDGVDESAQMLLTGPRQVSVSVNLDFHRTRPERTVTVAGLNGEVEVDLVKCTGYKSIDGVVEERHFDSTDTYVRQASCLLDLADWPHQPNIDSAVQVTELILSALEDS